MSLRNLSILSGAAIVALIGVGCSSKVVVIDNTPVQHSVSIAGENLSALTEITKSDETCFSPFGGDNGKNLFFAVEDKSHYYSNIFHRPDNPVSTAMSQKTGGKNHNMSPTYCAKTNQLAFAGRQQGSETRDIFLINLSQGNALVQLTNTHNAEENYPCLSQDGQLLVYQKRDNGRKEHETEIWLKKLHTGEDILLCSGCMPSFSPDGKTIVFVRHSDDALSTCIWTMNNDASNQMKLTDTSLGTVWHPRFSPDGRKIVFDCYKGQQNNVDLYVIDRNGSAPEQLTINDSYDGQPYWADDGNIYFTSDRGGRDKHYQIWRFRYGRSTNSVIQEKKVSPPTPPTSASTHTVQNGETITDIAKRYGVTVKDIVRWNNLMTMTITPGMKLKVSEQ